MCPSIDDEHADFPHRLVVPLTVVMAVPRDASPRTRPIPKTVMGDAFVICSHCDHWIERVIPSCHCREQCHQKAATVRVDRYRSVTNDRRSAGRV